MSRFSYQHHSELDSNSNSFVLPSSSSSSRRSGLTSSSFLSFFSVHWILHLFSLSLSISNRMFLLSFFYFFLLICPSSFVSPSISFVSAGISNCEMKTMFRVYGKDQYPFKVRVSYADEVRSSAAFPNPWKTDANIIWQGYQGVPNKWDQGGIMITPLDNELRTLVIKEIRYFSFCNTLWNWEADNCTDVPACAGGSVVGGANSLAGTYVSGRNTYPKRQVIWNPNPNWVASGPSWNQKTVWSQASGTYPTFPVSIAPGFSAIFTETAYEHNFDTSEGMNIYNDDKCNLPRALSTSPPAITDNPPRVEVTYLFQTGGTPGPTQVFNFFDTARVLDTTGWDCGNCGLSEAFAWTLIGTGNAAQANQNYLQIFPASQRAPRGQQVVINVVVADQNQEPIPSVKVKFQVTSGVDLGLTATIAAGSNGAAVWSYLMSDIGTDTISASITNALGITTFTPISVTATTFDPTIAQVGSCDVTKNSISRVFINYPTITASNANQISTSQSGAVTNSGLVVTPSGAATDVSLSAWFGIYDSVQQFAVAQKYRLQFGFQITFTFAWTGICEGFALVLQNSGPNALGSSSGGLGYAGIPNSIAIEFDGVGTPQNADPIAQHVSIHTAYSAANSASEGNSIARSSPSANLNFNSGTHTATVTYIPGTNGVGTITVGVDSNAAVCVGTVDTGLVSGMFNGAAYVGFTGSNSRSYYSNSITITQFSVSGVGINPAATTLAPAGPSTVVAGTTGSYGIQLVDYCSNVVSQGGDLSFLTATLSYKDQADQPAPPNPLPQPQSLTITDNNHGIYAIGWTGTVVQKAGNYLSQVSYNGVQANVIGFTVIPTTTSLQYSDYTWSPIDGLLQAGPSSGPGAVVPATVTITSKDLYNNYKLNKGQPDSWTPSITPDVTAYGGALSSVQTTAASPYYTFNISTNLANRYQLSVGLSSQGLTTSSPKVIQFNPGRASASTSLIVNSDTITATAGITTIFYLRLLDVAANILQSQNALDQTCLTLAQNCTLRGIYDSRALPNNADGASPVPVLCSWFGSAGVSNPIQCNFTATRAGYYETQIQINGVMLSQSTVKFAVSPNVISPSHCVADVSQIIPGPVQSGLNYQFSVQNYDAYDNIVPAALPPGILYTTALSSSIAATVPDGSLSIVSDVVISSNFIQSSVNAGQYSYTLNSHIASDFTLFIQLYGVNIHYPALAFGSGVGFKIHSIAGPANIKSSFGTPLPPTSSSAGQQLNFNVSGQDKFSHLRSQGQATVTDFQLTLTPAMGQPEDSFRTQNIPACSQQTPVLPRIGSSLIGFSFICYQAVNYSLVVTVGSSGDVASQYLSITGGIRSLLVLPGPTSASFCNFAYPGNAIISTSITLNIYSRDAYFNRQLPSILDVYQVFISRNSAAIVYTGAATNNIPASLSSSVVQAIRTNSLTVASNSYDISYIVPSPLSASVNTYYVHVLLQTSPGSWSHISGSPLTAVSLKNVTQLFAKIANVSGYPGYPSAQVGVVNRFQGIELDAANSATEYSQDYQPLSVSVSQSAVAAISPIPDPPALLAQSKYLFEFTPNLLIPIASNQFSIQFKRGSVVNDVRQGVNGFYSLTLLPGPIAPQRSSISVSATSIIAGQTVSVSVKLYDVAGNTVNYTALTATDQNAIVATFSPLNNPVSCTFQSSDGSLTCSTQLTIAQVYSVSVRANIYPYGSSSGSSTLQT